VFPVKIKAAFRCLNQCLPVPPLPRPKGSSASRSIVCVSLCSFKCVFRACRFTAFQLLPRHCQHNSRQHDVRRRKMAAEQFGRYSLYCHLILLWVSKPRIPLRRHYSCPFRCTIKSKRFVSSEQTFKLHTNRTSCPFPVRDVTRTLPVYPVRPSFADPVRLQTDGSDKRLLVVCLINYNQVGRIDTVDPYFGAESTNESVDQWPESISNAND
jgi:hypothetical protein